MTKRVGMVIMNTLLRMERWARTMDQDKLFELAFAYRKTKLWKKLFDTEMFAVSLPDGRIGYCSVMGYLGDHLALALYVGEKGLESFRRMEAPETVGMLEFQEFLYCQDCLQCALENKNELSPRELADVRAYASAHKISFRGSNSFPQFIKYQPAHVPWPLCSEEDRELLGTALQAALAVNAALESRSKAELGLQTGLARDRSVPLLTPSEDGFQWSMHPLPPCRPVSYPQPVLEDELLLMRLKKSKKRDHVWMCDVVMYPSPVAVQDESSAPSFPHILLTVKRETGEVIPVEPVLNYEEDAAEAVRSLAVRMLEMGVPRQLEVMNERTRDLLKNLAAALKIRLELKENDEMMEEIEAQFLGYVSDLMPDEVDEELGELFAQLEELDDDTLMSIPDELWDELCRLERHGLLSEELAVRVRRLEEER